MTPDSSDATLAKVLLWSRRSDSELVFATNHNILHCKLLRDFLAFVFVFRLVPALLGRRLMEVAIEKREHKEK